MNILSAFIHSILLHFTPPTTCFSHSVLRIWKYPKTTVNTFPAAATMGRNTEIFSRGDIMGSSIEIQQPHCHRMQFIHCKCMAWWPISHLRVPRKKQFLSFMEIFFRNREEFARYAEFSTCWVFRVNALACPRKLCFANSEGCPGGDVQILGGGIHFCKIK